MTLLLPLGLLGLLSIIGLILIYIFKPKYQEKKVSSTYVWRLSLKYMKRKVPLSWVQSSVLFIIQLLILVLLAFVMAAPRVVLDDKSGEKIAVIDASASMIAETDGRSRFDRAKSDITKLIDEATEDHRITIILAGPQASFVIRRSDNADYAKQKLFEAECSCGEADVAGAMTLAEGVLAENPDTEVIFYTDGDYADSGRVTVVNVSDREGDFNASLDSLKAERKNGKYVFTAEVTCYGRDAEFAVGLTVDGKTQLPKLATCEDGGKATLVWDALNITTFDRAEAHLSADDGFVLDNDMYIYNNSKDFFRVQLMGDDVGFLHSALAATGECTVVLPTKVDPSDPEQEITVPEETSGFDLYIYDGCKPETLPIDGAVWFVNPPADLPESYGIKLSSAVTEKRCTVRQSSDTQAARDLLDAVDVSDIVLGQFRRVISYGGFETLLEIDNTLDPAPVLLVREEGNVKTVVFALDLHWTNLPVKAAFPFFINNLCKYSMAHTLDKTMFEVGEEVKINARTLTRKIEVNARYLGGGSAKTEYVEFPVRYNAQKPGVYTVTQTLATGDTVKTSFFVQLPEGESSFGERRGTLINPIAPFGSGTDTSVKNNTMDISVYFIAALLVLLCVEWVLQYREQY